MKKNILIVLLCIFSLSGEAQNPKWLTGDWVGSTFPSHDETAMSTKLKLKVKSKLSKLILMYVDQGIYEKWSFKSSEEKTLVYTKKPGYNDWYNAHQLTISALDDNEIFITFFVYKY